MPPPSLRVSPASAPQVLQLWDRIVAYDDLTLLGVLSAAIFSYRRVELLRATTREEVMDSITDLRGIEAITLLQHYIFVPRRPLTQAELRGADEAEHEAKEKGRRRTKMKKGRRAR